MTSWTADQSDQSQWPAHLRDDAPSQRCDLCGRFTWAVEEFGRTCLMTQPSGLACGGTFRPNVEDLAAPAEAPPDPMFRVSARIEWPDEGGRAMGMTAVLSPQEVAAARVDLVEMELLKAVDVVLTAWRARDTQPAEAPGGEA